MVISSPLRHQRERPAGKRLGRDVADDKAVRAAAEAPIGDERDVFPETASHDRARRRKHLAHARPAARPFIADDDDVALLHAAAEDRVERRLFTVEDDRLPREALAFLAADFGDGAVRREVAVQNHEVAVALDRRIEGPDHILIVGILGVTGQILRERPAGHGHGRRRGAGRDRAGASSAASARRCAPARPSRSVRWV